jgi:hypothetical protein
MSRIRPTSEIANKRKADVLRFAYEGHYPKAIAPEVGLSSERVHGILREAGWRVVHLAPEEQELIKQKRNTR